MHRQRAVMTFVGAMLFASAGCFTMTNAKSAKVSSPGMTINLGGALMEDQASALVETRFGLVPKWDVGVKIEPLCYVMDTRLQFLDEERHSIDVAVEVGVGIGMVIRPFTYAGLAVSKDFGRVSPYCLFRHVDMKGVESEDIGEDGSPNLAELIITYVPASLDAFWEIFLGVEIELSDAVALVPEFMVAPTLDEGGTPLSIFNIGLLFRFD